MAGRRGRVWIGTSGWQYDHWRGRLYPESLPKRAWLGYYASRFASVEVNNTFYRLPKPETFDAWREAVPASFRFALKLSGYATHRKRLREPEETLARFFEGAERLGSRLGPLLVQLPPRWRADPDRLDAFLAAAPRRRRFAVELRDPSWLCDAVFDVLRRRAAALVVHDLLPDHPEEATADWVYWRFHGAGPRYAGGYSPQKLAAVAKKLRAERRRGRDVYVYFNNDAGGRAPIDAARLRRLLADRPEGEPRAGRPVRRRSGDDRLPPRRVGLEEGATGERRRGSTRRLVLREPSRSQPIARSAAGSRRGPARTGCRAPGRAAGPRG